MPRLKAGLALGVSGEIAVAVVTFVTGFALLVMERLWPQQPEWLDADGQWWCDLGHFVLGFGAGTFGGTWLAQALVTHAALDIWPAGLPLVAQVALGLLVAEFTNYWQHRAAHSFEWLWPLHALHHSTERMTFFKTTRIHALDIGSTTFLSLASLIVLGAPASVLLWVTAFGNFAAQTQHANVPFRTPAWLNAIVGTPAVHWLHHSIDRREGHSNFGMNVMIFDHLFGTWLPPGREPHAALGIEHDPVPATFLGQLATPWRVVRRLVGKE
jgi:ornithine lipid hydroxylase